MSQDIGRIPGTAYKVCAQANHRVVLLSLIYINKGATGALFGVALIAYAFPIYVQLRILHQFAAEDWVLVLSVACLIACTTFNFVDLGNIFFALRLSLYGLQGSSLADYAKEAPVQPKRSTILLSLWRLTVFGVKLAYLLFFRKLVLRLKCLTSWWWLVVTFVVRLLHLRFLINS